MPKLVFRNYNEKEIKSLMQEIGKERVRAAIDDSGMPNRPLSMEGFFIEFRPEKQEFVLAFMYPSRTVFDLMEVNGFWRVPDENWVKERI